MKIFRLLTLLLFILSFTSQAQDTTKVLSNFTKFKLPDVEVKTLDGQKLSASSFKNDGKPIIISFWAMWCTNCLKELKTIQEEYSDWQEETGVKLIAISVDDAKSVDKVKPFVNGKNWDYEIYLDTNKDLYRAMNVNQVPHTFLVDGNGNVVWQHVTYTEGQEADLYNLVKKLSAGQSIDE